MGRLDDKVAVITGGASGLGRACALRFAEEGADVVIGDRDEDRARKVAKDVENMGRRALVVPTDTSKEQDCDALAAAAAREMGSIDVLVAAAGISHASYVSGREAREPRGERAETFVVRKPVEHWQRVLDVNLTGVMLTNRAVASMMIDQGRGGAIVNIASGAAKMGLPGAADYCVSKAGVWMLTKCLALELAAHRIRVNAVGPGFIETPMTASFRSNDAMVAAVISRTPVGRLGLPEDIANACLYLVSDEASFVTGEILYPDGGLDAASR
jgi:NAD(P)-dependent dehydrogenase (short-subunit alcohol dehydrogenase family)